MNVLAIVVTYNGIQWYYRCFSSLRSSSIPVDVIAVDNASSDDTVEFIKSNFPEVIIYESNVNLGFGQANNKGIRYALEKGYDFVFLLNQDAWLAQNDAVEQLINAYNKNQQYAILSPVHLYGSGISVIKGLRLNLVNNNNADSDLFSDLYFERDLKEIYTIDYACAAAWLIPSKILQNIGGFDPLFFHYGEDDNYIQRIIFHGYKIGVCPYSSICHDVEFRGNDYGKDNNNWQKNLLVELGDVNKPFMLIEKTFQYFYFSIVKLLFLKFKSVKANLKFAIYILKKKSAVKKSYFTNKQCGPNWL